MPNIDSFKDLPIRTPSCGGKYQIGIQSDRVCKIADLKPTFAFDYISVRKNLFCFNADHLGRNNFINLIKGLKAASQYTFKQLEESHTFHFHDIDFDDVSIRKSDFYTAIISEYNGEDYIIPYQMKVYKEERVIGFLYEGTFYLVMYDSGHQVYGRKKSKQQRRKKK